MFEAAAGRAAAGPAFSISAEQLPPSSEGLTRLGAELIVVIDGDASKEDDAAACRQGARQLRLAAP